MDNVIQATPYFSTIRELGARKRQLEDMKIDLSTDATDDDLVGYLKCLNEIGFLQTEAIQLRAAL